MLITAQFASNNSIKRLYLYLPVLIIPNHELSQNQDNNNAQDYLFTIMDTSDTSKILMGREPACQWIKGTNFFLYIFLHFCLWIGWYIRSLVIEFDFEVFLDSKVSFIIY